jgi:hypothetical protein
MESFRALIIIKCGIKAFPFTHILKYRQACFIDINNSFGRGHNAVYSITGVDKTQALFISSSLE